MSKEIWKDIEGYEGHYQASSLGKVRSLDKKCKCKEGYESTFKGKVLSQCFSNAGYYTVNLCKNGKTKTHNVHLLIAKTFIPNPKGLPCANHKDLDKSNNNIRNLEWMTYQDNALHYHRSITKADVIYNRAMDNGLELECSCVEISKEKWDELMSGAKKAEKAKVHRILIRHGLKSREDLKFYNPYDYFRTETHLIYVHSAIEYFYRIKKSKKEGERGKKYLSKVR